VRRRLLLVLLPLLTALLGALEVPVAQTYAAGLTQVLFINQIEDAQRFAAKADRLLRDDLPVQGALDAELRRHAETYGVEVTLVDRNEEVLIHTGAVSSATKAASTRALAGDSRERPRTAWPWRSRPMVVAASIGPVNDVTGAVVIEGPTSSVRTAVGRRIAVLAVEGLGVLALTTALCVLPLAAWLLRPVYDLSSTAARLTGGELGARASETGGPPELRMLAGAFNRMAESLVAALERQRAFVADASHELRNPLGTLRLRIEGLAGKVHGRGEHELALALVESDRLAAIVDRLLELARAEATAAERVDFDLVALTAACVGSWKRALQAVGSVLRLQAPEHAWSHAPPQAVEYALDVLLDNARKFAPGSPVDVSVEVHHDGVELRVRDHGAGLDATEISIVSQRFWRSPRHRAIPGTGLGLATSRALIEAGGGSFEVVSGDCGLTVALRLAPATGAAGARPDTSV
jgi:signal transduction histidine kinase